MKVLLIGLVLTQQAPAMKCVEWKPQTKTVCEDDDHTLGGAVIDTTHLPKYGTVTSGTVSVASNDFGKANYDIQVGSGG